jgi:hypothetical protein
MGRSWLIQAICGDLSSATAEASSPTRTVAAILSAAFSVEWDDEGDADALAEVGLVGHEAAVGGLALWCGEVLECVFERGPPDLGQGIIVLMKGPTRRELDETSCRANPHAPSTVCVEDAGHLGREARRLHVAVAS